MKFTNFFVATAVVIVATLNFGVQGSPRPQLNIELESTNVLSLDPLGILFGRPTSEPPTSPNDPSLHETNPTVTSNPPSESPAVDSAQVPRRIQSDAAVCADNCRGTSEYNPVCGSDGIMYNNPGHLICARNCGVDVTQRRTGRCPPPSSTVTPDPVTPVPVTATPSLDRCVQDCVVTAEYKPVCGSDRIVYTNAELLTCMKNCGISVTQLHTGVCSAPSPTVTPKPPTPAPATVRPDAVRCAQLCMVTPENDPVCGSDGVTYRNTGLLICTRNCGINVTQRSYGPCIIEDPSAIDPRTSRP